MPLLLLRLLEAVAGTRDASCCSFDALLLPLMLLLLLLPAAGE
jgi:hypothetical protein